LTGAAGSVPAAVEGREECREAGSQPRRGCAVAASAVTVVRGSERERGRDRGAVYRALRARDLVGRDLEE